MISKSRKKIWPYAGVLVLLCLSAIGILLDASAQRSARREALPQVMAVARMLGTADLALSSASRWLRHPSLSEPGAAFADGPAILDNDPAGAAMGPPRELLGLGAEVLQVGRQKSVVIDR